MTAYDLVPFFHDQPSLRAITAAVGTFVAAGAVVAPIYAVAIYGVLRPLINWRARQNC